MPKKKGHRIEHPRTSSDDYNVDIVCGNLALKLDIGY
jgi:hypothetical protein